MTGSGNDSKLSVENASPSALKSLCKWGPGKSLARISAFYNGLSAFRPNVTLACYQQAGRGQKAESLLTLAESRAVGLP